VWARLVALLLAAAGSAPAAPGAAHTTPADRPATDPLPYDPAPTEPPPVELPPMGPPPAIRPPPAELQSADPELVEPRSADAGLDPGRELEPCRPRPGEILPGFCSPDIKRLPDPSNPRPSTERPYVWPEEIRMPAERGHRRVEKALYSIARRMDDFFGNPDELDEPPAARMRFRGGLRTEQGDPLQTPDVSLAADLRLPSLDALLSRARIYVSGGEERDEARTADEGVGIRREFGPSASLRGRGGAAELRFDLYRDEVTLVDFGAGIRFRYPPPPYVRARAARAAELGLGVVAHGNQTLFWATQEGFGEATRVDLERVLGRRTIARLFAVGTVHEESRGFESTVEGGLQQGFGPRTGIYFAGGLDSATRPAQVDRYRVFARLRRDVYGGWLFGELEPEVFWPLRGESRPRVLAFTVRLEVHFRSYDY
jgi:hypothetical protein